MISSVIAILLLTLLTRSTLGQCPNGGSICSNSTNNNYHVSLNAQVQRKASTCESPFGQCSCPAGYAMSIQGQGLATTAVCSNACFQYVFETETDDSCVLFCQDTQVQQVNCSVASFISNDSCLFSTSSYFVALNGGYWCLQDPIATTNTCPDNMVPVVDSNGNSCWHVYDYPTSNDSSNVASRFVPLVLPPCNSNANKCTQNSNASISQDWNSLLKNAYSKANPQEKILLNQLQKAAQQAKKSL